MDDEEEISEDEMAKQKLKHDKIRAKLDKFMAEISVDMLDEGEYVLAKKKILKVMTNGGLPTTLSYVKAFKAGYEFSMATMLEDKQFAMMLTACISRIVSDMQNEMDIKVAKSTTNLK